LKTVEDKSKRVKKVKAQLEVAKEGILVELESLGYSKTEIKQFKTEVSCPRCGRDFSGLPYSGRWLAHFSNCEKKSK
jgi:hypothetical protein